jgi:RNA polymerase sigma factor (sigma-70 family)
MVSDEELIKGCKNGKHSAYEILYKKYAGRMMAIAMRYANTTFEAEDIVQDAFIKVFEKISSYESKGSFEGWLKRVVVNTAINHYHKTAKERFREEYENLEIEDTGIEESISRISNDELLQIIKELPKGYNLVFNLYAIEGYTHIEIAEMLEISEGTSKSQLSKARQMLKKLLIKHNIIFHE